MRTRSIRHDVHALVLAVMAALALPARALCTSDGVTQPVLLLERFINADCADCWSDRTTPDAAAGALAIDWVLPGTRGDDAPLSAVASDDATARLAFLRQAVPARGAVVSSRREGQPAPLRVAQGAPFNDYIGASIAATPGGGTGWAPWLLLVERLPAGTEGSPVVRNLVRNVFRPDWARSAGRLAETRSMQIHEGARPERLRLVAVLHDGRGRLRGLTRSDCRD